MSKRRRLPRVEKCPQCGRPMRRTAQQDYQYRESGLDNVYLHGIVVYVCECGEEVVEIPQVERLHGVIVRRLLLQPRLLQGQELRFLRRHLGLKAADFAQMLDVDPTTFSRWETGAADIGAANEKLFRFTVVLQLSERHRKQREQAHRDIADMYLDILNAIKHVRHREHGGRRIDISRSDVERGTLSFFVSDSPRSPAKRRVDLAPVLG